MRHRTAVLWVLLCSAAGCCSPFHVRTESRVTVNSPPTASAEPLAEMFLSGDPCSPVKVAVVDVDGLMLNMDMTGIYSLGENPVALFREKLEAVAADPCVRAVVLRINSPGGGVTATDIMWHDLTALKARRQLPVVACLMDVGAGGAYYLATGADQIIAHPTSVTGGIGVILNLYNLQETMAQFNVRGVPIKAGEHVDMGSPIYKMGEDGRKLLQDMADEFHARFCRVVEQARPAHNPQRTDDFDGRVFTAQQALDSGLIDSIGYLDDAIAAARELAHCGPARIVLYRRCSDRARNLYAITPNVPLQASIFPISIPGFDRSRLPTFLYVWQADPGLEKLSGR